nr:hypothetical protein [Cellulomonas endophytica]
MSASAAQRVPVTRSRPTTGRLAGGREGAPAPRSRLRLVTAPLQARTRVPFVLLCMAVLGGALLAALLLNTTMATGAYEAYRLSNELGRLQQDRKDLEAELDRRAAPAALADAATGLGMVPADGTGWVRLSDGWVQGAQG